MSTKPLNLRIDESLADDLKNTAQKYGTSQSAIVVSALNRELLRIKNDKKPLFENI